MPLRLRIIVFSFLVSLSPFSFSQALVTISDGTTWDVAEPVIDGVFDYGWGSTVYTQTEMGAVNVLSSICWYVDEDNLTGNCPSCTWTFNNVTLYLAHYNQTVFPDDIRPTVSYTGVTNWTLVFSGNIMFSGTDSWQGVNFTTPFSYDGTSNLIVHVENNDGSGTVSTPWFYYQDDPNSSHYRNKSKWQNGSFPVGNADNPGSLSKYKYAQVKFNASCNNSILPVELTGFSAACDESSVKLNWETASETNNAYFTLERSNDGKVFSEIEKINGAGNTTVGARYEFMDHELPVAPSAVYYRLSQTDFDGTKKYFRTITAGKDCFSETSHALSVAYDPVQSALLVRSDVSVQNTELCIFNMYGQKVFSSGLIESSLIRIPAGSIPGGIYLASLSEGNAVLTTGKFVITDY